MNKLLVVFLLPLILFLGCTSQIKDDLINYVDVQLPPLVKMENEAIDIYDNTISNDDYTYDSLYTLLKDEVIPKYSNFVKRLDNVSIVTSEVEVLHNIYKKAANTQLEGLNTLKEGIRTRNKEDINKSTLMFKRTKSYIDEFNKELNKLMDEYDIN